MKQDRFLTGIIAGVAVLILAAVSLFYIRQNDLDYVSDDTPEGVVHNFVFALQQKDYNRAYGYLSDIEGKPSKTNFVSHYTTGYDQAYGLQILDSTIFENGQQGDTAVVELSISQGGGGPFGSRYSYKESAELALENGEWKIFRMPYQYWEWNWYTKDGVPIRP
ncbi:MAG: hypothetical protein OEY93_06355 [Anaerolineae bacterium]|nr:hypothetical protein [Anaerolineae bacterium]